MNNLIAIVGSGLAGLNLAINLARKNSDLNILVLDKSNSGQCNSQFASGGLAATKSLDENEIISHFKDTLDAGCGINDKLVVEEIIKEGPGVIKDLLEIGVTFNKNVNGTFDMHLEGGHSERRIYHHDDTTGKEILDKIAAECQKYPKINILKGYMALDLITEEDEFGAKVCSGMKVLHQSENQLIQIKANAVIIASGGIGQLYKNTTNSDIATGDGIAMAIRAGVEISDMEFIQFHPTALYQKDVDDNYLITEAIRGEGAKICDAQGNNILKKYEGVNNLSPRYKVSLAIDTELKKTNSECVFIDCSEIDINTLQNKFRSFWNKCLELKLNPLLDKIPILPVAHYLCGGIKTDINGCTNLTGLFAVGECAQTGFHGANRLASNSLLEALVVSKKCSTYISEHIDPIEGKIEIHSLGNKNITGDEKKSLLGIRKKIKDLMQSHVGIVRSRNSLSHANNSLSSIRSEFQTILPNLNESKELYEVRNMLLIAEEVILASEKRTESIGSFYINEDH